MAASGQEAAGERWLRRAHQLLAARSVEDAYDAFVRAQEQGEEPDACSAGSWQCSMLLSRFVEAWQASDAIEARRLARGIADSQRFWDGKPLTGRHVMLRCLHGFGDALQFIRFAPQLAAEAASLYVEAHPRLCPLLRACDGVGQVITWGPDAPAEPPPWDAQIEIMEVPWILRVDRESASPRNPYLQAQRLIEAGKRSAIRAAIASICAGRGAGRLQVGFSWRSSEYDLTRSVPAAHMLSALHSLPRVDLWSLQYGTDAHAELLAACAQGATAARLLDTDFASLALAMAELDAVVTVDGVVAHLAGSMGLRSLVLLPFAADWRWGLRNATPWYPRAQLFRQSRPSDWSEPLRESCAALAYLTQHEV